MPRMVALLLLLVLEACSDAKPGVAPEKQEAAHSSDPFECDGLPTCVEEVRKLSATEANLKTEFDGAIERIRSCKPENSTRCYNLPHAIELIDTEQQTWLAWRNAHCNVFVFGMEDTSAEGELRAYCRNRETTKRIAELKQIRND